MQSSVSSEVLSWTIGFIAADGRREGDWIIVNNISEDLIRQVQSALKVPRPITKVRKQYIIKFKFDMIENKVEDEWAYYRGYLDGKSSMWIESHGVGKRHRVCCKVTGKRPDIIKGILHELAIGYGRLKTNDVSVEANIYGREAEQLIRLAYTGATCGRVDRLQLLERKKEYDREYDKVCDVRGSTRSEDRDEGRSNKGSE